ncbi:MAG: DNA-binding protein [Hyphomicrobiaceae bacterium]|nr:MAG: DNA-binding protein [Hyphomicrobiaceae bacterium]
MAKNEELLTTPQVARLLECCRNSVEKLWRAGELTGRLLGNRIFIEFESVKALLDKRRQTTEGKLRSIEGKLRTLESGAA